MNAPRHQWGEPNRFVYKTERVCSRCGLVKVTRHELPGATWTEWWRDGERVQSERTPTCMMAEVQSMSDEKGLPAWNIRTGSWKSKFVLVTLAAKAEYDIPADLAATIAAIADVTELTPLEVKLALDDLMDRGHVIGQAARAAGYDDVPDLEVGPGVVNGPNRRVFAPR